MKTPRTLQAGTALKIIKNEKVLCESCLFSKPDCTILNEHLGEEWVECHVLTDVKPKKKNDFCKEGLWRINGKVMEFKEAFEATYKEE